MLLDKTVKVIAVCSGVALWLWIVWPTRPATPIAPPNATLTYFDSATECYYAEIGLIRKNNIATNNNVVRDPNKPFITFYCNNTYRPYMVTQTREQRNVTNQQQQNKKMLEKAILDSKIDAAMIKYGL